MYLFLTYQNQTEIFFKVIFLILNKKISIINIKRVKLVYKLKCTVQAKHKTYLRFKLVKSTMCKSKLKFIGMKLQTFVEFMNLWKTMYIYLYYYMNQISLKNCM